MFDLWTYELILDKYVTSDLSQKVCWKYQSIIFNLKRSWRVTLSISEFVILNLKCVIKLQYIDFICCLYGKVCMKAKPSISKGLSTIIRFSVQHSIVLKAYDIEIFDFIWRIILPSKRAPYNTDL